MTLVDRYVAEVARRLPRSRRADISRELTSTLLDAMESRFGPAATDDDAAVVLQEFGRPDAVAASYWPASQYLIGPEWYPAFSQVLKIHLLVLGAIVIAGLVLQVLAPSPDGLAKVFGNAIQFLVFAFGVIVLIFHLLERGEVRVRPRAVDWDPHDLPSPATGEIVGRVESIAAIIATLAGFLVLVRFQEYIGIPVGNQLLLNNILVDNLPWIGAAAVLTVLQYIVLLWQGRWRWYMRCYKVGVDLFNLIITWRISNAVIASHESLVTAGVTPQLADLSSQLARALPFVVLAVMLYEGGKVLFRVTGWTYSAPALPRHPSSR